MRRTDLRGTSGAADIGARRPAARAVVIGASIAGLLAACALREEYGEIVVLDRDDLPDEPLPRSGVPHARHSHALLTRGREVIEQLLPGISDELVARGAVSRDAAQVVRVYPGPRHLAPGPGGLFSLVVSRGLLEHTIRRRVGALPGVTIVPAMSVLDLTYDDQNAAVTGVVVGSRGGCEPHHSIDAALVVDASGRTARTSEWLERHGYPSPREERVRIDATYATRRFRHDPARPSDVLTVLHPAVPGTPRGGIAIAQEGDAWSVSVAGYHGERPPTDLPGFMGYLRRLCSPALAELVDGLEPLDDGAVYRFPANVRRRYERLELFPEGLVVVGDAMCAFDPTFGQGMTVAALEALDLREILRQGPADLSRRFFAKAARHVDVPWEIVVRNVPRPPGTPDTRPLAARLRARYVRALQLGAIDDPVLTAAFLRVTHMVRRPQSLFAAPYLLRTLRAALARAGHGTRLPAVHAGQRAAIGVWDPGAPTPHRPPVPARHARTPAAQPGSPKHDHNQTGTLQ